MTTISVRVPDEQAMAVKALALAEDVSASEVARTAIGEYIDRRRGEREAQRRRRHTGERNWAAFDLIVKSAQRTEPTRYTL
ncbi:MAG TPA: DUF6290 family protein [Solirubrobacteraceae bacterium]|jgi:predicted transcriptional regulator|nr:DUF6290 family protein [Solirubrobacteraceae bacterium]